MWTAGAWDPGNQTRNEITPWLQTSTSRESNHLFAPPIRALHIRRGVSAIYWLENDRRKRRYAKLHAFILRSDLTAEAL